MPVRLTVIIQLACTEHIQLSRTYVGRKKIKLILFLKQLKIIFSSKQEIEFHFYAIQSTTWN